MPTTMAPCCEICSAKASAGRFHPASPDKNKTKLVASRTEV